MELREKLVAEARKIIRDDDPSHDLDHALRVLRNSEYIFRFEGGDLEIITPAALFHDSVNYPKNDPRSKDSPKESASLARSVLERISEYDQEKITRVENAIIEHSYSNGIRPESLDSKIVQDADRLEATGAISIMRTFSSTGQMKRKFYHIADPFCKKREPDSLHYAIDLFYSRLLKVSDMMNTDTARNLAKKRAEFLQDFLAQLEEEMDPAAIIYTPCR